VKYCVLQATNLWPPLSEKPKIKGYNRLLNIALKRESILDSRLITAGFAARLKFPNRLSLWLYFHTSIVSLSRRSIQSRLRDEGF